MKTEILRMEQVLCTSGGMQALNFLSMNVFKGEIYGIVCLEQQGIRRMIELICRNGLIQSGQVFFGERLVNRAGRCDNSRNRATVVGRQSRLINDLSLADNLFVMREGYSAFIIPERTIKLEAQRLFDELGLSLDTNVSVRRMGHYDRIIAEILRAVIWGERLIILWEISDMLGSGELPKLNKFLRRLTEKGYTFLYIYSHHEVLRPVCDRLAVFSGGSVVKVLWDAKEAHKDIISVFTGYAYERIMQLTPDESEDFSSLPPVLELKGVRAGAIKGLSFCLRPGENVLLIDRSNTIMEELVRLLAGKASSAAGRIGPAEQFGGRRREVAVITGDPISTTLFHEMSFLDNLCMSLQNKIPMFWQKKRFRESVRQECEKEFGGLLDEPDLYNVSKKDLYTLIYYRYLLSKPKVVVCQQPLSGLDLQLRLHILGLLSRLRGSGIAVLVLNTELYDTLQIADRLILVENGKVVCEHTRSRFNEASIAQSDMFPD